jgi:dienelactone hydrolase
MAGDGTAHERPVAHDLVFTVAVTEFGLGTDAEAALVLIHRGFDSIPTFGLHPFVVSDGYGTRTLRCCPYLKPVESLIRALVLALLTCLSSVPLAAQERVEIPGGDEKPLKAILFKPAGQGPFPAVIALHGCGGLGTRGGLGARHADWAERLRALGVMVLFPDSFGSRGLDSQCLVADRTVRPGRERVTDTYAARAYLLARSDVSADRISLLGWSNGASSVLWSIAADKKPRDGQPDFRAAVAFYPGCRLVAQAAERRDWENRIPLLVLIGEADTWTPAAPCRQLVRSATQAGRQASVVSYPGAAHDFDHPSLKLTRRTGLAFTGDGSGEAYVGTDPSAREDALLRVPDFFGIVKP